MYKATDGLVEMFSNQKRLILALDSYSQTDLNDVLYPILGLPKNLPKQQFIEIVKQKTNNLFK